MARLIFGRSAQGLAFGASYGAEIVIQGSDFASTFDNYPLLLCSDSDTNNLVNLLFGAGTSCLNNGGDLRACTDPYDEGTRLPLEVVRCLTATNGLEIWINVGTVTALTNKTIYLLWGIPGATQPGSSDPYGAQAVWNRTGSGPQWNFVTHMHDFAGQDHVKNSTSSGLVCNKLANDQPQESGSGTGLYDDDIHQDWDDSIREYITVPWAAPLDLGTSVGVMIWVKWPQYLGVPSGYPRMLSRKNSYLDGNGWEISFITADPNHFEILGSSSTAWRPLLPFNWNDDSAGPRSNGWHCLQVDFTSGQAAALVDGVSVGSGSITTLAENTQPLVIGDNVGHSESIFKGRISEVRLAVNAIADDLWKSMYTAMADPENHVTVTSL